MSQQQRDPQTLTNVEEDSVPKSWNKQGQALLPQASSHDTQKQNHDIDSPCELTNEEARKRTTAQNPLPVTDCLGPVIIPGADENSVDDKPFLNGRCWAPKSLESRFSPRLHHDSPNSSTSSIPHSALEPTQEQNPLAHDCAKYGHQPRIIHNTHSPPYSAEVGRLDTTAKLPNISWLPFSKSRGTAAPAESVATTNTAATTNTIALASFVVCDICGQSLPSVPLKVAYRGGQTQVIRYNHQVFRRDFVRARQAPHRIREMARMAEEKNESKTGEE